MTSLTSKDELPHRCIFNDLDMKHFMQSTTKKELLGFVEAMGKSCTTGNASFDNLHPLEGLTPCMASLHGSLSQMMTWVDDFPPTNPEAARFGNPAFRLWHARLLERSNQIITVLLEARNHRPAATLEEYSKRGWEAAAGNIQGKQDDQSIQQVSCYLHDSFGHATRLDYGTGHESSFLVFLLVLSKVKCLGEQPSLSVMRATTLSIMDQYLKVTRRLQTEYRLEPAGSHGVWGLDDYHCLPFYFGACQFQASGVESDVLADPSSVTLESVLKDYGDRYLYLSCIRYIRELKSGVPFFESSPMLYDISQTLSTWDKVARGMLRLYQGEVLDKRVVVQHFVFSKLFPATWTPSQKQRAAPIETFRGTSTSIPPSLAPWASSGGAVSAMPPTRAPWAVAEAPSSPVRSASSATSGNGNPEMSPTRAPWAEDDEDKTVENTMLPTKAPWAK